MKVFLHSPQKFENLCSIARTLEVFGVRECWVFDPNRIVRERYGKSYSRKLASVSRGAFFEITWHRVEDTPGFLANHAGRVVATTPSDDATPIHQVNFREDDLLLFGSETLGLPDELLQLAALRITVPQSGKTESLNLSVACGIVAYEYSRQRPGTH